MSSSSVPTITIDSTGVTVPETSAILAGALSDINAAFGGNLNIVNVGTPQGVLASELTDNIAQVYAALAYLISMVDPASSEGRFQDGIARIYFLTRKPATATVVSALCTGSPGSTLPAGALAEDDAGYTYASLGDATFGTDGLATVDFQCQTLGAISCGIGSLVKISQAVSGWDAITNLSAGVVGSEQETRAEFEDRRSGSVSANAHGSPAAIFGAVSKVDGVTDCCVRENETGDVKLVGATNYPMIKNSIFVSAVGGTDADIAKAIWSKKGNGCNYNGNTTVAVTDTSGYATPYPEYSIKFERPAALSCKVAVTITNNSRLPSDIVAQTKAAIISAWTGADNGDRARIASDIYASRYYAGVAAISSAVSIVSILIGTSTPTAQIIHVGIDQVPTLAESDITVTLA